MYKHFFYRQNISQLFLKFLYLCDVLSQQQGVMDVDLLSKMIKELILDKDRVVLPGLGCFVAEMVPSTFSDKGYTINPPYRKLSFRSKPDMGDELIDFYTEANGLDRDVACRILGDFIRELRQVIFTKKVVILPGLGRLRATKENHLFFIPEEGLDIYPAGIGLEPISLKTHVETQQEVASAVAGLKSIMEEVVVAGLQEDKVEEDKVEEVAVSLSVSENEVTSATVVEKPKRSAGKKFMITMIVLVVLAVVLLAAFAVVARMMPGVFDTILYTPEELEILNYIR